MDIIGIEVGNTRTKLCLFKNNKLKEIHIVPTRGIRMPDIPAGWEDIKPELVGLASVVPGVNTPVKDKFENIYGKEVFVIKPSNCGMPLRINNPEKVGIDRILNCRAARELFGSPSIVVDIGTAITIDVVSPEGGFAGGIIIPGIELWTKALQTTAMIKDIKPAKARFPGKDTNEAICAGIKYGMHGAMNNILDISFRRYPSAMLILTGGGSDTFKNYIRHRRKIRKYLTVEGMGLVLNEMAGKF